MVFIESRVRFRANLIKSPMIKKMNMKTCKIGDTVAVLDDDLSGIVTKVKNHVVTIETPDGFELDFEPNELVVTKPMKIDLRAAEAIIREKEQPKRKQTTTKKAKERYQPTMEVDLH